MPYIKKLKRTRFNKVLNNFPKINNKGELEFVIFKIIKKYMSTREYRYSNLHDAVYATIHAGEEFKRRYLDERENQAIVENGDIEWYQ